MLELTTNAKQQFLKKTAETGHDSIRVGVKSGGCNGYEYIIDYANSVHDDDHILDFGEFLLVVDPDSIPYLEGSTLDYTTEGLSSEFKFANPNVTMACGCGLSVLFEEIHPNS
jgi:iron-sulfur cluster assembly protein